MSGRHGLRSVFVLASCLLAVSGGRANAQPKGPRVGPSPGYRDLAAQLSNLYTIEGQRVPGHPNKKRSPAGLPDVGDLMGVPSGMEKYKDPTVVAALAKFQAEYDRVKAGVERINEIVDGKDDRSGDLLRKTLRGEVTQKVESTQVVRQSDGTTKIVTRTDTVADFGPAIEGMVFSGIKKAKANAERSPLINSGMEQARMDAWSVLVEGLDKEYSRRDELGNVIRFRMKEATPGTAEEPSFTAVNTGRTALTNVTMLIELVHFATAPNSTTFQPYFLPKWEPGGVIHLPLAMQPNHDNRAATGSLPPIAEPWQFSEWLDGVGGVIEIKVKLYASEGRQPEKSTKFPRHAAKGAEWELHAIAQVISMGLKHVPKTRTNEPMTPAELFKTYFNGWCEKAARRVVGFMPPDSELGRRAKHAIADPEAFYRETLENERSIAKEKTTPGKLYRGTWAFHYIESATRIRWSPRS